jgi:hypothetical protein
VLLFALVARHDDAGGAVRDRGVGDDLEGARMEGGGREVGEGSIDRAVKSMRLLPIRPRSRCERRSLRTFEEIGANDGRRRREGRPKRRRT